MEPDPTYHEWPRELPTSRRQARLPAQTERPRVEAFWDMEAEHRPDVGGALSLELIKRSAQSWEAAGARKATGWETAGKKPEGLVVFLRVTLLE